MNRLLVTGIDTQLGALVATALARVGVGEVIGLGAGGAVLPGVEVRPPVAGEALADLLRDLGVRTVLHPSPLGEEQVPQSREQAIAGGVLGTVELIGACARAKVRRLVLRSSSHVYGGRFDNPAFLGEERPVQRPAFACLQRDYCEVEAFVADFARRRSDRSIVVLRCAPLVGPGVSSPFVRYLAQEQPQTAFGFDPRIQVLHLEDAARAFVLAAGSDVVGPLNIAADDLLTLLQAIRLNGKQPLPFPTWVLDGVAGMLPAAPLAATLPFEPALLRYPCVADTARAKALLGWQPQHTAAAALAALRDGEQRVVAEAAGGDTATLVNGAAPALQPPVEEVATVEGSTQASDELVELELEVRSRPDVNGQQDLAAGLLALARSNLDTIQRLAPEQLQPTLEQWRERTGDYLDPDFWQGLGMMLRYQIGELSALTQRRLAGNYRIDPYGLDPEIVEIVRPFLRFMYTTWWRTTTVGIEHVPGQGRGLLVANHSGVLPWDGAMVSMAVLEEHPQPRLVRNLFLGWFSTLPGVAPLLTSLGQVHGLPENAVRLLGEDELVCVFPEGLKGVGKPFRDRYRLARFGRGGFVQAALRTGAPLVPVAIVGAEETYPLIANIQPLARLLGFPYVPITPFFPWLGLFGAIPLPTKWTITFCPPIPTAQYGPEGADDPLLVAALCEQVRGMIQTTLDEQLAERRSVF